MIRNITSALAQKRSALGQKEKGFTLIELLVVVLIIGVLAAIAIPIFLGQQDAAKDNAAKAQVTSAKTAIVAAMTAASPTYVPASASGTAIVIPGYTPSADIPLIDLKVMPATGAVTTFCISAGKTGHTAAIDNTGAAVLNKSCSATTGLVAP